MWDRLPPEGVVGTGLYATRNGCHVVIAFRQRSGGDTWWVAHALNTRGEPCRTHHRDRCGQGCWRYRKDGVFTDGPLQPVAGTIYHSLQLTLYWRDECQI